MNATQKTHTISVDSFGRNDAGIQLTSYPQPGETYPVAHGLWRVRRNGVPYRVTQCECVAGGTIHTGNAAGAGDANYALAEFRVTKAVRISE